MEYAIFFLLFMRWLQSRGLCQIWYGILLNNPTLNYTIINITWINRMWSIWVELVLIFIHLWCNWNLNNAVKLSCMAQSLKWMTGMKHLEDLNCLLECQAISYPEIVINQLKTFLIIERLRFRFHLFYYLWLGLISELRMIWFVKRWSGFDLIRGEMIRWLACW